MQHSQAKTQQPQGLLQEVLEMCDKQRARSTGKRGRSCWKEHPLSRATPLISQLLPTKGQHRESPPSAKKGPLTNAFGHSRFARKGLEKLNKSWYFTPVTLDKEIRAGDQPGTTQALLFGGHSTPWRVSSWIAPEVHLLLRGILFREVIQVRTGFLHLSSLQCTPGGFVLQIKVTIPTPFMASHGAS